jgi:hypothetical protein
MPQPDHRNPWLSMWSHPRVTISVLVQTRPSYGVYSLATLYALQSFFFFFNWWSLGSSPYYTSTLILGILLSPLFGILWIYGLGFIYFLTGKWLKGKSSPSHIRTALAWSKIPYSISLGMWLILILMNPVDAFVHDSMAPSFVFINIIGLILETWALVLLIASIREVQHFSILRSIVNIALASFISAVIFTTIFCFFFIRN